jgi:hypothetical protein
MEGSILKTHTLLNVPADLGVKDAAEWKCKAYEQMDLPVMATCAVRTSDALESLGKFVSKVTAAQQGLETGALDDVLKTSGKIEQGVKLGRELTAQKIKHVTGHLRT